MFAAELLTKLDPALLGALVAIFGSLLSAAASRAERRAKAKRWADPSLETRVDALALALKDITLAMRGIEDEIAARQNLLEKIKDDAERYERLAAVHREQADAIVQMVRGELEQQGKKGNRLQLLQNAGFFILGIGASVLIAALTGS